MNEVCLFPGCNRHPQSNKYCIGHRIYANVKVEKETPKSIAKVSEKRKEENKEYKKIVVEMMKESKFCEVKSPVCTKIAQGLNHKKKRSPKTLLDKKYLERACNPCNLFIEENQEWAEENGHVISKYSKV